ncbi:hypothetical protein EPO56_02260 [Patescibacteria group bacterium]|nr:MAG: hypothetical protein EPO56_02260 [Patescibacteria group bacterium]
MSATSNAYSYPNPPTENGAITTANTKCTGSYIGSLGSDGSDAPPSAPSWSILAWGFLDGSLLPSNYNNPGSYCIQATRFSNSSTWNISYALYSGSATASQSGRYTLTYTNTATPPTASISLSPSTITSGNSSALTWSSTNASTCTGTGFATGNNTAGTVSVSPSQTSNYSVSCTGAGGTVSASATLTVTAPSSSPTVSLTASPSTITAGGSTTLSWTSSNASYCSSTQFDTIGATSGSVTITPNASTNYTVTCTGSSSGGTGTWQYYQSDYSDLSCPVSSNNNVYSAVPDCPASPQGKSCTSPPSTCKINTIGPGCGITTELYSCQVTSPPPSVSGSAYVTASNSPLTASCMASPTSVYKEETVTWSSSASGGDTPGTSKWKYLGVANTKICTGGSNSAMIQVPVCPDSTADGVGPTGYDDGYRCKVHGYDASDCDAGGPTIYGNVQTFESQVTSGSAPVYSYSWSGTDGLSGISALISKTYSTTGTKTGSVTVTTTSTTNLQSNKQCSGGTLIDSAGTTEDGVVYSSSGDRAMCDSITPAGGCCSTYVREVLSSGGQPVNTYYQWTSYSGASLVTKDSYSTVSGGNTNNHYYSGGFKTNSTSTTASCSNSVEVSVVLSDLTAGAISPTSAVANVAKTFSATITNAGNPATGGEFTNLFQRATSSSGANTVDIGTDTSPNTSANGSDITTFSYAFPSAGTWYMRACADKNSSTGSGIINESNETNNCGAWTAVIVSSPPLSTSCAVTPTSGYTNDNITWTATPSGGTGSYTYSWSGTDGLSGTTQSVVKQYTSTGTKTGSITVTSGASSVTQSCSNSVSIAASPTALLSASPSSIIRGSGSSQLTWSSTNATSCTSTKFATAGQTSGAVSVTPTSTTNYDLTCTNASKNAYSSATVTVYVADLTLTVSPNTSVRRNNPATVNWSVSGSPDSCLISGPGLSSTAFAGSQSVIVGQESTYTFSCTAGGITTSKSVTIRLTPAFEEF